MKPQQQFLTWSNVSNVGMRILWVLRNILLFFVYQLFIPALSPSQHPPEWGDSKQREFYNILLPSVSALLTENNIQI